MLGRGAGGGTLLQSRKDGNQFRQIPWAASPNAQEGKPHFRTHPWPASNLDKSARFRGYSAGWEKTKYGDNVFLRVFVSGEELSLHAIRKGGGFKQPSLVPRRCSFASEGVPRATKPIPGERARWVMTGAWKIDAKGPRSGFVRQDYEVPVRGWGSRPLTMGVCDGFHGAFTVGSGHRQPVSDVLSRLCV